MSGCLLNRMIHMNRGLQRPCAQLDESCVNRKNRQKNLLNPMSPTEPPLEPW